MIHSLLAATDVTINSKVEEAQQKIVQSNRYALAYRDEFYRRLPKVPATFLAASCRACWSLGRAPSGLAESLFFSHVSLFFGPRTTWS